MIPRMHLTGTRHNPGEWSAEGNWIEAGKSTIFLRASVQPAPAEEVANLPEGLRKRALVKLFTDFPLRVAVENTHECDTVEIFGDTYEVVSVAPWQNKILPHYSIIAARVEGE